VLKKHCWLEIMGDNTELKDANGNYLKNIKNFLGNL